VRRIALVAVLCVGACLLAGCGDDDEEALSEEAFLEQGNAICAAGNDRLDAAFDAAFAEMELEEGEEPSPEQIGAVVLDVLVPEVQSQIDDIRSLEPPDELADEVEQFVDDAQATLDQLEQQATDDPSAVFSDDEDPFVEVNAQANEIGLTECADDGEDDDGSDLEAAAADIDPDPDHPYCDVEREVDAIFEEAFGALPADASEEDQLAAAQEASQQIIDEGLIDEGEAAVPDVIRSDFEVLAAAVQQAAEGDFESLQAGDAEVAGFRVDTFCGQLEE
jgi:hypothetical protein